MICRLFLKNVEEKGEETTVRGQILEVRPGGRVVRGGGKCGKGRRKAVVAGDLQGTQTHRVSDLVLCSLSSQNAAQHLAHDRSLVLSWGING